MMTDTDRRATIAARLETSTDAELVAMATRWHEASRQWMTEVFTESVRSELNFWEHFAGYNDPYGLYRLARARETRLDKTSTARLSDYVIAVVGVFEMVHFGIGGDPDTIPDPWITPSARQ